MNPSFHLEIGPWVFDVELGDAGIRSRMGPRTESIPWERVSGATLVRTQPRELDGEDAARLAQLASEATLARVRALEGKVGEICLAYRDERNRLRETKLPAPLDDAAYLEEFPRRLGSRWLGETPDRERAAKRLGTNPGFFRTVFVMVALLGIVAAVVGIAFLGLLGPVLNFLSIERMLLDLQDGNLGGFLSRLATYLVLFSLGYLLHRVLRRR